MAELLYTSFGELADSLGITREQLASLVKALNLPPASRLASPRARERGWPTGTAGLIRRCLAKAVLAANETRDELEG